jgi:hypothetical protein
MSKPYLNNVVISPHVYVSSAASIHALLVQAHKPCPAACQAVAPSEPVLHTPRKAPHQPIPLKTHRLPLKVNETGQ